MMKIYFLNRKNNNPSYREVWTYVCRLYQWEECKKCYILYIQVLFKETIIKKSSIVKKTKEKAGWGSLVFLLSPRKGGCFWTDE